MKRYAYAALAAMTLAFALALPPLARADTQLLALKSLFGPDTQVRICDYAQGVLLVSSGNCLTPVSFSTGVWSAADYAIGTDAVSGNTFCIVGVANLSRGHHLAVVTDPMAAALLILGCVRTTHQEYPVPSEIFLVTP